MFVSDSLQGTVVESFVLNELDIDPNRVQLRTFPVLINDKILKAKALNCSSPNFSFKSVKSNCFLIS